MTLQDQYILLIRLKCCSANLADKISTNLQHGFCNGTQKLTLLNGYIELIKDYNVEDNSVNCLSLTNFEDIVTNATNICNLCNCN